MNISEVLKLNNSDFRTWVFNQLKNKIDRAVYSKEDEKWRKETVHKIKDLFSE